MGRPRKRSIFHQGPISRSGPVVGDQAATNNTVSAALGHGQRPWMRAPNISTKCPVPACGKPNASFALLVRHVLETYDPAHNALLRCPANGCERYLLSLGALLEHVSRSVDIAHRVLHFCVCDVCGEDLRLSDLKKHVSSNSGHGQVSDDHVYRQLERLAQEIKITDGMELPHVSRSSQPTTPVTSVYGGAEPVPRGQQSLEASNPAQTAIAGPNPRSSLATASLPRSHSGAPSYPVHVQHPTQPSPRTFLPALASPSTAISPSLRPSPNIAPPARLLSSTTSSDPRSGQLSATTAGVSTRPFPTTTPARPLPFGRSSVNVQSSSTLATTPSPGAGLLDRPLIPHHNHRGRLVSYDPAAPYPTSNPPTGLRAPLHQPGLPASRLQMNYSNLLQGLQQSENVNVEAVMLDISNNRAPAPLPLQFTAEMATAAMQEYQRIHAQQKLSASEILRCQFLYDAAETGDHLYVVLHQISCIYDTQPDKLSCILHPVPTVRAWTLDWLLDCNEQVRPGFKHFWARFPADISSYANELVSRYYFKRGVELLDCLDVAYISLVQPCKARGWPPTAREICHRLEVASHNLARLVHGRVLSEIWGFASIPMLKEAFCIFIADFQANVGMKGELLGQQPRVLHSEVQNRYMTLLKRFPSQIGNNESQMAQQHPRNTVPDLLMRRRSSHGPSTDQGTGQVIHASAQRSRNSDDGPLAAGQEQSLQAHPGNANQISRQLAGLAPSLSFRGRPVFPINPRPTNCTTQYQQVLPQVGRFPTSSANAGVRSGNQRPNTAENNKISNFVYPRDLCPGAELHPPVPQQTAVDQASLRSPIYKSVSLIPEDGGKMYQYMDSFALHPQSTSTLEMVTQMDFEVSARSLLSRPERNFRPDAASNDPWMHSNPSTRPLKQGTRSFRLRCNQGAPPSAEAGLSIWTMSETAWPDGLYFELNNIQLETRRKIHFGRNLPVDVTHFLNPWKNTLTIRSLSACTSATTLSNLQKATYSVAIESIVASSQSTIKSEVLARTTPASDTVDTIRKTLQSTDEDIACLDTTLLVKLMDPILAVNMWRVPVRTKTCLHREAFDLDTFLQTRPMNPAAKSADSSAAQEAEHGEVSKVDVWECPICGVDARPDVLSVDGWLVGMREELEKKGLIDEVKCIEVDENGNWTPKKEEKSARTGRQATGDIEDEHGGSSAQTAVRTREVVMIDDD